MKQEAGDEQSEVRGVSQRHGSRCACKNYKKD